MAAFHTGNMAAYEVTGNETWAYVPTPLFRGGSATALPPVPNDPRTGLGALAYQDGALFEAAVIR